MRRHGGDRNLHELSSQVRSPLFLAHIRAATGTPVEQTNCHPFRHGRWLFMHNGFIEGYFDLRRELLLAVEPALFSGIAGTTDSELMFYLALTFGLQDEPLAALDPDDERIRQFSDEARAVVSEPLGDLPGLWHELPAGTAIVVQPGADERMPFTPRR